MDKRKFKRRNTSGGTMTIAPIAYDGYITRWDRSGGDSYRHLHLNFYVDLVLDDKTYGFENAKLEITWQQDQREGKPSHWYAMSIEIHGRNPREIVPLVNIVRKIDRAAGDYRDGDNLGFHTTPERFFEALDKIGAVEVVHDSRLNRRILPEERPSSEYQRWTDDYDRLPYRNVTVDCLARDEDHAKTRILQAFGARLSEGYYYEETADRMQQWLAADRPVRMDTDWFTNAPRDMPQTVREEYAEDEAKRLAEAEAVAA